MNIPPAIFFINSDIGMPEVPPPPAVLGADPSLYIGAQPLMRISELTNFQQQLNIDDTMTKQEFDARMVADPEYAKIIHLHGMRILVLLDSFDNVTHRNLADVVLFVKQGTISVQKNKFDYDHFYEYDEDWDSYRGHKGRPRLTLDMQRLNVYELLRYNHSKNVATVPDFAVDRFRRCETGVFGCECDHCRKRSDFYKWIPENQPGKPPYDPEEGE